jgi:hypothetical protein
VALRTNAGYGLLILDVFLDLAHNDAPQSVGLLWTIDELVAETSTWQHTTLTTDKYPCPRWDSNLTISVGERPQTYALDRAATGNGHYPNKIGIKRNFISRGKETYWSAFPFEIIVSVRVWILWMIDCHSFFEHATRCNLQLYPWCNRNFIMVTNSISI